MILPLVHHNPQGVQEATDKHCHPVRTLKGEVQFSSIRFGREPLQMTCHLCADASRLMGFEHCFWLNRDADRRAETAWRLVQQPSKRGVVSIAGVMPGVIATVMPTPSDVGGAYSMGASAGGLGASFAR